MSFPIWDCQLTPESQPVHVGTKMRLLCQGEPLAIRPEDLRLLDEKGQPQFELKILEVVSQQTVGDSSVARFEAIATSYKPGQYKDERGFLFTDGKQKLFLKNNSFEVQSVLPQGQQVQPVPPYGPITIGFLWWMILAFVLAIVLPLVAIYYFSKKKRQRQLILASLHSYKTLRDPYDELYKDFRSLERQYGIDPEDAKNFLADLEKYYRMFLIRELHVPALQWSDAQVMKEIKQVLGAKKIETLEKPLKALFKEFAKSKNTELSAKDCHQILGMTKSVSEAIFKLRKQRGKA